MANFLKDLKTASLRYQLDEKYRFVQEAQGDTRNPEDIKIASVVPRTSSATSGAEESDVDLTQIAQAYYSDSYISRAINKIVGLMFKEGWRFSSRNADALEYIEKRFKLMEESTGIKTNELLRELGLNFVLFANGVLIKTRGTENTGDLEYEGYLADEPISGLFVANPQFINITRDDNGNVENYIVTANNEELEFDVNDVTHLTYQKPSGMAFGIPYITNTIRDVLVLRQIEQTVANILYRTLHPLQVYTVGVAEPGMEAKPGEIEQVEIKIAESRLDSMFIVPERHKIESVRTDYLDASAYLKYFRQRIFTGLGVSESTMGIGDTANRSTSDNQSNDLIDLVKDFQQNFMNQFQKLIDELLFEGGYDPTLIQDDIVKFEFIEIEQSAKIARENHEIQKWFANLQSIDETRLNMGYEPAEDLSRFYFNVVKKDTTVDNSATVDNNDMPENQNGKQMNPNEGGTPAGEFFSESHKNNADLTNNENKVILQTGNQKINTEQLLVSSWKRTLEKMKHNKENSVDDFKNNFNYFNNNDLFDSKEEKELFTDIISKFISNNESIDLNSDKLYRFDSSLISSYNEFVKVFRKEI